MNRSRRRGQSVLYGVLLMPMLLLIFALAIDIGTMQLERLKLHYALDLATLTAASNVDKTFYSATGQLRLDPSAAIPTTRESLIQNLTSLRDAPNSAQLAGAADVVVVNQVPGRDPFSGASLDRPAVCARIRVPHRFSLLGLIGLGATEITVTADAEIRT